MLIRHDERGMLLISQPAHAWLAGQLARAWGNERFGEVSPREEIVLAATLHDAGWLDWESAPTLNRETGLPHTFLELPIAEHLRIWDRAAANALAFGPLAALFTSLHGSGLYERRTFDDPHAADARAVSAFLERERERQASLRDALRRGDVPAAWLTQDTIDRNRRLIAVWDTLSLFVCYGGSATRTVADVPARVEPVELTLSVDGSDATLWPWPFATPALSLTVQARRIDRRWTSEDEMRTDLARAPWETLAITLRPAEGVSE